MTVGSDVYRPGDPNGVIINPAPPAAPFITPPPPAPWSGWPADWATAWGMGPWTAQIENLTDIAWACLDLNSSVLAAMPPYLVGAASSLDAAWMSNPDPDRYTCWEEFARELFWDFQGCGEAFVVATAWYRSGWPARFHLLPPPSVDVELDESGRRVYHVGGLDITSKVLHIRYKARVTDPRGQGPLHVGRARCIAANLLARYVSNLMDNGGAPTTALTHPNELTAEQSAQLQNQWIAARRATMGAPAVLSGGVTFQAVGLTPSELALSDLASLTEARIAILLRTPAYLVGLPQSSDSLVYNTAALVLDFHWRAHLRNLARPVVAALSYWALPAGTALELNRDEYVKPGPLERAQYYATMHGIADASGEAITVPEIRILERFDTAAPTATLESGVLQ